MLDGQNPADTRPAQGRGRAYRRLLAYALRDKGRIALMVFLSIFLGFSFSGMLFAAGTTVNILFLDDDGFAAQLDRVRARTQSASETLESAIGWSPQNMPDRAVDIVTGMRDDRGRAITIMAVVIFSLTLLGAAARMAMEYYAAAVGINVSVRLNREMYANLLHLSLRYYDSRAAGEIIARFTNDSFWVNRGLMDVLVRVVREPARVVFLLLLAVSVSPFLTLIALFVISPLVFFVYFISRTVRVSVAASLNRLADTASLIGETVRGIPIVKVFRMEENLSTRMNAALDSMRRNLKRVARADAAVTPLTEVLLLLGVGAFLVLGMRQISDGQLDTGRLLILLGAFGSMLDPLRKLSKVPNLVQASAESAARVFEIIDQTSDVVERPNAVELPPLNGAIRFERVRFGYTEDQEALRGVTFDIPRGGMVALVGFSGSGKSTIAKLLPRLYDPDAGRITFDGRDLRDATLASLRTQIAMVTQENVLFQDTVGMNIAGGDPGAAPEAIRRAAQTANADGFIEALPGGYDARLSEAGGNLSGGQRQRLAIARAVYKDPAILILDEATSSLDSESERAILDAIDRLIEGRTTLVIAHRLSTILKADKIIVLDDGHVVDEGTHAELLARDGLYRRLYRLQFADAEARVQAAEN